MDCLAGQQDLVATDGPPDVARAEEVQTVADRQGRAGDAAAGFQAVEKGSPGHAYGDWAPNACPLETPGKAGRAPHSRTQEQNDERTPTP